MGSRWSGAERGVSRVALVLAVSTITLGVASAAWAIQAATTARAVPDRTMRVVEAPQATVAQSNPASPPATATPSERAASPSARPAPRPTRASTPEARSTRTPVGASPRASAKPTPRVVISASISIGEGQDSQGESNAADD